MKENDLLKKTENLLGNERELIVLKGKLFSPQLCHTKDNNDPYYTFKLKVLKSINDDEYGQSFNTYYLVIPVEVSKKFSDADLSAMKNNEVIVMANARATVKNLGNPQAGNVMVVNNISLYVLDIMLCRTINNEQTLSKVINL